MYIFDSQSEFYRYPQGGIKSNDNITLKIYIKKNLVPSPKIIIEKRDDYNTEIFREINMEWVGCQKSYDLYKATFSINLIGNYYYSFKLNEYEYNYTDKYELLIYSENYKTPDWIKGGIIYHIFVDRFYRTEILKKHRNDITIINDWGATPNYLPDEKGEIRNNDFFGGNLEGIIEKLKYIHSLGVNTMYLSPVFDAYSNHKYDTGDYLSIDTMFGSSETLMKLCSEAKNLGMYIILDGVFSHTGSDSIYFNEYGHYNSLGAFESKDSPYYDWYMFNESKEDYVSWWGIKTLPTINKKSESYIDFITGDNGVLVYWQKKGIKGWRLDVADELPNEFLEKLRSTVKNYDNESYIVGEVWEDASDKFSYGKLKEYFCGNQLDSVTNYPLKSAIIHFIMNKDCSLLNHTINFILEKYPPQTVNCLMNIIGTHDTARILTVLGCGEVNLNKSEKALYKLNEEDLKKGITLLKIASLLQFTLPGVPCIYYGDEVGMEGFEDPFNRACFPWGDENDEILNHYKFLSKLRKNKLFAEGKYKNLIHEDGIFVFTRYEDNTKIVIAVNMSEEAITLNFKEKMMIYDSNIIANSFNLNSKEFIILE